MQSLAFVVSYNMHSYTSEYQVDVVSYIVVHSMPSVHGGGKEHNVLQAKFGYRLDDPKWAPDWLPNEQLEMLHSDIDARQIIDGEFEQITKDLGVSITGLCVCLVRLGPA